MAISLSKFYGLIYVYGGTPGPLPLSHSLFGEGVSECSTYPIKHQCRDTSDSKYRRVFPNSSE